ncbi:MAG: LdpA C-terminal domain-containing domain [Candidatus Gastranaerophilales bacterium]|nr:LdpA C-terminal domain-containing domain [Candidatus Gastranaerophilales bacterium]
MQKLNSISLNRAIAALENKRFVKLICGASNTDQKQIERLVMVYSLAGVDVVDISPDMDSFASAKTGIDQAKKIYNSNPHDFPKFNEPLIMISLNTGSDKHFRKAEVDFALCSNCLNCTFVCPAGALYESSERLQYNLKSCYGCARCIEVCKKRAISLDKTKTAVFVNDNCEAVEIHTGNSSFDEVKSFVENNSFITQNIELISFSIEASLFDRKGLIEFVHSLASLVNKKVIIQIDGKPMGADNSASSSLQALAAAQVLSGVNSNFYIQIAGGINHLTKSYVKMFNLSISGVGYGTFARKIILPYIVGLDDVEFLSNLKKCVNITTNLVEIMEI